MRFFTYLHSHPPPHTHNTTFMKYPDYCSFSYQRIGFYFAYLVVHHHFTNRDLSVICGTFNESTFGLDLLRNGFILKANLKYSKIYEVHIDPMLKISIRSIFCLFFNRTSLCEFFFFFCQAFDYDSICFVRFLCFSQYLETLIRIDRKISLWKL